MGLGLSSGLLNPQVFAKDIPPQKDTFTYPGIISLKDATNHHGEVALRLALGNNGTEYGINELHFKIQGKGSLSRTKSYFLEPPDQYTPQHHRLQSHLHPGDFDVMVVWMKEVTEDTIFQARFGEERWRFTLGELLEKGEMNYGKENFLTANFLGYAEVGPLEISSLDIQDTDNFRFAIMADPQGGDPDTSENDAPTRMKIHNAFIEDTVRVINELEPKPVFTMILGDFVDSKGQEGNFLHMEELVNPLVMPILLGIGNHETPYNADFTPAYNMSNLDVFFRSQKRINGLKKILYSFNIGKWHFVVWPDPLRQNFWSTHPHYFDWLENDLQENEHRSVIFLHHVPLHPIGIDPLTSYVEAISVRRLLVDILTKHGNVKYVFSGHVHIPLKASLKTAVEYKGMRMINLPAAGYRPRAFGEADFFGGPEQGVCILDIEDQELTVNFQHVTGEWFTYPKELRKFDDEKFALWFNQPWELTLQPKLVNGDFSQGLKDWHQRYVHHEDKNPSNICEVRQGFAEKQVLYLYCRKRDYDVPGQDRLPQHINRIAQAISLKNMVSPIVKLTYQPHKGHYNPTSLNGFFMWLECYSGSHNVANLIYSVGKAYGNITGGFGSKGRAGTYHFDLPYDDGQWHSVSLSLAKDYSNAHHGKKSFSDLKADRVILYLGTWTVNEGIGQEAGIFIKKVDLINENNPVALSTLKSAQDIWSSKVDHVAGDHQYVSQDMVYPKGLQGKEAP